MMFTPPKRSPWASDESSEELISSILDDNAARLQREQVHAQVRSSVLSGTSTTARVEAIVPVGAVAAPAASLDARQINADVGASLRFQRRPHRWVALSAAAIAMAVTFIASQMPLGYQPDATAYGKNHWMPSDEARSTLLSVSTILPERVEASAPSREVVGQASKTPTKRIKTKRVVNPFKDLRFEDPFEAGF